jgi:leucyl-tRNA synthetase
MQFKMSVYNHKEIEKKWQNYWKDNQTFKTEFPSAKPKYFVLDMFPYPSGAGLHVGHPLGYIATDIVARYKRLKGFNVLHPMGYDSFGLPAEQYAIQTGQHPAITTEKNIARYREQLDNIGFSYDWTREIKTSDPKYYKWTQWIFIKLFNHWYNKITDKAEPIEDLIVIFENEGNLSVKAHCDEDVIKFDANQWESFSEKEQYEITLKYRLAFLSNTTVNWCPALGTVLANEEVKDGLSERGGYPVVRKEMAQWSLRITAYAQRLIDDLDLVDWNESIKEQQKYWIGKSKGCMLTFKIQHSNEKIDVFTTRVDTIYGVTYLTLAPEHPLVEQITTVEQKNAVEKYVTYAKNKSERDRQADVKTVTGEFTGAFSINPLNGALIPIWIGEYVLAGYGTGAVMAVPSSDTRDYAFAKHFNLPIILVQEGSKTDITKEDFDPKAGTMINSDFLNGMKVPQALEAMTQKVEELGVGYGKINFKIRDAIFSRQRYWGEPIPVYYKDGLPYVLDESQLPLTLPEIDEYKPTESGEPPLARAKNWTYLPEMNVPLPRGEGGYPLETNTMPGWAGSSWYFLRYMDNENNIEFASKDALDYWQQVDLYLGGSEHATGHLLYSRFWHKFLFDLGYVKTKEYAKKLINQGMIQGVSASIYGYWVNIHKSEHVPITNQKFTYKTSKQKVFILLSKEKYNKLVSTNDPQYELEYSDLLKKEFPDDAIDFALVKYYVDISLLNSSDEINLEDIKKILSFDTIKGFENEKVYVTGREVEKMSKSKLNVVNPDDVVAQFGADCLRLYEMFLGPLELSKPWSTSSISGVSRFLKNVWKMFYDENGNFLVEDSQPTPAELKTLHKTIKKVEEDIERFSFNTSVSTFMVCVNELSDLKCHKKAVLEPFLILLAPYAPHISEELWASLGHPESITYAQFPVFKEEYLVESSFEYPISINGKVRHKIVFDLAKDPKEIEKEAVAAPEVEKWLEGKTPKKVIVVQGRIVNVVI